MALQLALDHRDVVSRAAFADCLPRSEHLSRSTAEFASYWWNRPTAMTFRMTILCNYYEERRGVPGPQEGAQGSFVDDPCEAVHAAGALVADVMQRLAATFAEQRQELEGQWNRGERADADLLRLALRRYRSFLNRLRVS
ncbi:hypothetical protein ACFWFU_13640 [Streptomyces sp. NPDC060235]|uniref:hypothetical protein n=1 Tax=Streptomyces sp. NPDC060235 TaxID=3347080 RepID=UPI00364B6C1A